MLSVPTRVLLALLLVDFGVMVAVSTGLALTPVADADSLRPVPRPNVVLIMTDDMAVSDLRWMPRTRRVVGGHGMTFDQGLAPNPWCCPAGATILTGQESHNNNVWSNKGSHGGYGALPPGSRLPEWLQDAGYRTAFFGKHLNGFQAEDALTGARLDRARCADPRRVLLSLVHQLGDGDRQRVRDGYVTHHLWEQSADVIRRFERHDRDPFFLWVSHVAPHVASTPGCGKRNCWQPPVPASRDLGSVSGVPAPTRKLQSWNHRNDATKPPFLRDRPRIAGDEVDLDFQRRVEALQSVDRSVAATVRVLRERGELHRTLLVFTSDNGYMLGQHRHVGKRLPYEESIRVPLLVRGPGVASGSRTDQLTTATDLTRTVVEVAGAKPDHALDGVSLVSTLSGVPSGRGATILQNGAEVADEGDSELGEELDDRGWLYRGYRDTRWTYVRYPDPAGAQTPAFEELYDLEADPVQLHNLAQDPEYAGVLEEARRRAAELSVCVGATCHPGWEAIPHG